MQLAEISQLDLYFLAQLVGSALKDHHGVIHRFIKEEHGEHWLDAYNAGTRDFRASVDSAIKEETEANAAVGEQAALRGKFTSWRRLLENCARRAGVQTEVDRLLKAAGYGDGTPRSTKEFKDFLVIVGPKLKVHEARFRKLGASPKALAFPGTMSVALDTAGAKVVKEVAEARTAREAVRTQYDAMITQLRLVDHAAQSASADAALEEDKEALARANALLNLLDAAEGQAKVEARKKATEEEIPESITLPVNPDAATPEPA
ncbi:MAG: hypothetical protein HY904_12195 [Deltaproteobacteria bacterium]|nr:hypothetical protein [Deltaproteobacteria bacterium]